MSRLWQQTGHRAAHWLGWNRGHVDLDKGFVCQCGQSQPLDYSETSELDTISLTWFIIPAFAQALVSGAVTVALMTLAQAVIAGAPVSVVVAKGGWVMLTSFILNKLWWHNAGQRIDRHGQRWAGTIYSATLSIGTTLGGWLWVMYAPR